VIVVKQFDSKLTAKVFLIAKKVIVYLLIITTKLKDAPTGSASFIIYLLKCFRYLSLGIIHLSILPFLG